MLAPAVTRFSPVDLSDKAAWILKKLKVLYPAKSEVVLANWLRMMANRNDCLFIRTPNAVALAEVVVLNAMDEHPVIFERFVWCEDRQDHLHIEEAATLYNEFKRWARSMGVEKIIVNQFSDVPREQIKEVLGRLNTEQLSFARV